MTTKRMSGERLAEVRKIVETEVERLRSKK